MSKYFLVLRGDIDYQPLRYQIVCVDETKQCFTIKNIRKNQVKYRGAKVFYSYAYYPKKLIFVNGNELWAIKSSVRMSMMREKF